MSFRFRLAMFFALTIAIVQALTAVFVYDAARRELIGEGERQLDEAARAFSRQLDDISERVAENVQVLALDYALRSAIAQHDRGTVLSALKNHGRRVGAERMLLIGLDGAVEADTLDENVATHPFPFPELVSGAMERPAAAVVALDGKAYWMIVAPVYAPAPIALIAAGIPIDDALLARMQRLSALPNTIELVSQRDDGPWVAIAHGTTKDAGAANLSARLLTTAQKTLPPAAQLVTSGGHEYVALAMHLKESPRGAPVAAVLGYSLDDALRPFRAVSSAWTALLGLGLIAGLIGALVIARGVSRPVEALAANARRIAAGDYSSQPLPKQSGEIGELAAALANMTEAIREREVKILHQADHDDATGLPNRPAAERAIERALATRPDEPGALLMVGLARLPEVIQTMGHALADRLMRDAGTRVQRLAGAGFVARATDTQFSVWLDRAERGDAIAIAFRILDVLGEPYQESDLAIDVAPAVGIALCPTHGREASVLLRHAEVALFGALGAAEPVAVYDAGTDPHRPERLSLMGDLREALDANALELHYQPKLDLATGTIDGAEALVRWHHAKRGFVPPDAFIGLAEETGNIRRLTRWVLARAIAQARQWSAQGLSLRIAVNLSARDLDDRDLPRRISELLSLHEVPARAIVLEITESAVMGEPDAAIDVLKRLADLGLELAIDDFGVGQSSFAYLRRLPVRELKIDKTFIAGLAVNPDDRTIVRSLVELGHRLGYRVTAEGVEDGGALAYLAEIGCDHAQGYRIAAALRSDAFERFIAERAAVATERRPA